jgi:glucoamylase
MGEPPRRATLAARSGRGRARGSGGRARHPAHLIATQLAEGRWQQNRWLGGTSRWHGVRLDEVAWPVLLAARFGVKSHYPRSAAFEVIAKRAALLAGVPLRPRGRGARIVAAEQVSTDFPPLVRFGLWPHDHPVVRDTLNAVDGLLRSGHALGVGAVPLQRGYLRRAGARQGLAWRRPRGRLWPLLTGERGHYALRAGEDPLPHLKAMNRMAGGAGLIPEQVWDEEAIPRAFLYPGKPTSAAMLSVWGHAE